MLSGQTAFYVNQKYVLHVPATAAVHAGQVELVAVEGTTAVELPLRRKVDGRPTHRQRAHARAHACAHAHAHAHADTYAHARAHTHTR